MGDPADLPARVEEALAKYPPHDGSQHEDVFACNWMDAAQSAGNLFPALAADWQRLREHNKRLANELSRSFMALPLIPSNTKAWDGSNLYPHVVAVADEFAIRTEQIAAHSREVERLRERERVLTGLLRDAATQLDQCAVWLIEDRAQAYEVSRVENLAAELRAALTPEPQ